MNKMRRWGFVCVLVLCLAEPVRGAEPAAPLPTAAVQTLLDGARALLESQQFQEALKQGEQALAAAREASDAAGEARAHEVRARALAGLGRREDAVAAWQDSAVACGRIDDRPGQVLAMAENTLLQAKEKPTEAQVLSSLAIAVARAETTRPLAAAKALADVAQSAYEQEGLGLARLYWAAALDIQEKHAPQSAELALTLHNLGSVTLEFQDIERAKGYLRRALELREKLAPNSLDLTTTLMSLGRAAASTQDWETARGHLERALTILEKIAPDALDRAICLNYLGHLAEEKRDLRAAAEYYRRVLALLERIEPGSANVANALINLGNVSSAQGELPEAVRYFRRALGILEQREPNSAFTARVLRDLGDLLEDEGNFKAAGVSLRRALAIEEKLEPESLGVATSLESLGKLAWRQEEFAQAKNYHRRALAIRQKRAPESPLVAASLEMLGLVARSQGDLPAAREYHLRALALLEQSLPASPEVALCLVNLGGIAKVQGDFEAAKEYYRRALILQDQLGPESRELAITLDNLAGVLLNEAYLGGGPAAEGLLREARQLQEHALAIFRKLTPNSLYIATSLNNIANVALNQGDLTAAEEYFRRALAIQEQQAPDSLMAATILDNMGGVAYARGDLKAAESYRRRALTLFEKVAPFSQDHALCLYNLGMVAAAQNQWAQAERRAQIAWRWLRRQAADVAGDEARQAFGASTLFCAELLARAQIALGRPAEAFQTVEESRAQALQQLLAERSVAARALPPRLWSRYQMALGARIRAEQAVSDASSAATRARRALARAREDGEGRQTLSTAQAALAAAEKEWLAARGAYTQARLKADEIWAEITRGAPRAFIRPISTAQAQRALAPGTLFIAFLTGRDQTELLLLSAKRGRQPSLLASSLPIPYPDLLAEVQALRSQVTDPDADAGDAARAGRALFARLFPAKARQAVREARRLVISPDGPLWELPFAALVMNTQGPPRFLGAEKAISYTQSLTLFTRSREERPRGGSGQAPVAVVLGNPVFDRRSRQIAAAPAGPRLRGERAALFTGDEPPPPLPATEQEAKAIARLYGHAPLLGEGATEAALRGRLGKADVIHLATHGLLHPIRPMSSGVLLTVPAKEPEPGATRNDGALQAWEIHDQMKLRAELVVLSACETGRGQTVTGEGVVGMTRSLQYAGARSIVASQWKVPDTSTRQLMVTFHQKLRAGAAKDEALRQAMAAVRKDRTTAHPYHWAAFFLVGDPDNYSLGRKQPGR